MEHNWICFMWFFYLFFQVQVKLFVPQSYRYGSSNLWTEFFGTVYDSEELIAKFAPLCNILGRCLLVRIMEMKNDYKTSNWVIHKVLELLEVCKFYGMQKTNMVLLTDALLNGSWSGSWSHCYAKAFMLLEYVSFQKFDSKSSRILYLDFRRD